MRPRLLAIMVGHPSHLQGPSAQSRLVRSEWNICSRSQKATSSSTLLPQAFWNVGPWGEAAREELVELLDRGVLERWFGSCWGPFCRRTAFPTSGRARRRGPGCRQETPGKG